MCRKKINDIWNISCGLLVYVWKLPLRGKRKNCSLSCLPVSGVKILPLRLKSETTPDMTPLETRCQFSPAGNGHFQHIPRAIRIWSVSQGSCANSRVTSWGKWRAELVFSSKYFKNFLCRWLTGKPADRTEIIIHELKPTFGGGGLVGSVG